MFFRNYSKHTKNVEVSDESNDDQYLPKTRVRNVESGKTAEDSDVDEEEESESNEAPNDAGDERGNERGRPRKRKRRKRRPLTICTSNCRYEVVRRVAYRLGMREVSEDDSWNVIWTDLSISVERCRDMKRFQKINHFPGMSEICRKDLLARNLNRMFKLYPDDYHFFPKSWCLPADMADVVAYSKTKKNKTYILKPDMGCQGRGISITKSVRDIPPHEKLICQVYITKPFLIDGYKFDIRVYTLITSCDPLRIFVYNDGLVRFATSRYREPTGENANNIYMHLTNYAVNKHNRLFVVDDELGSKRKISTLNRWFEARSFDVHSIWAATDDVIVKTIIAAHPILKHSYHTCFPTHDYTYACFELLGFDILLDEDLKPYVLEVNHSPSFHTDSQMDRDVKEKLLQDTFQILNLNQYDKRKIMEEDRRRVRERLLKGIYKDQNAVDAQSQSESPLSIQVQWEEDNKGNFRKVYPCDNFEKYEKFFQQNSSSLFQDTAASRAREEASRLQREESLCRAKQEAARQAGSRIILERLRPESPSGRWKNGKKHSLRYSRQQQLARSLRNSFDPAPIVEVEELERQYQLKQREFLVRSYGLIETIYTYLKKNRSLRPDDERKYGGNVKNLVPLSCEDSLTLPKPLQLSSLFQEQITGAKGNVVNKISHESSTDERKKSFQSCSSILGSGDAKALCVRSNEARMSIRPVPTNKWPFHPLPWQQPPTLPILSNSDIRSTKAQVARSYTNSVKLRQLERRERHGDRET